MSTRYSEAKKRSHVIAAIGSGNITDYCRRHKIRTEILFKWKKELKIGVESPPEAQPKKDNDIPASTKLINRIKELEAQIRDCQQEINSLHVALDVLEEE